MKNRLTQVALILLMAFLGYGCSDGISNSEVQKMIDNSLNDQRQIVKLEVKKGDWIWNSSEGQYEAILSLPELKEYIYEDGAILGYVFLGLQDGSEVQKTLPYINTYKETLNDGSEVIYTETISFDVQYASNNNSTVAFYIKASDLARADQYLANYNFRIVLIY